MGSGQVKTPPPPPGFIPESSLQPPAWYNQPILPVEELVEEKMPPGTLKAPVYVPGVGSAGVSIPGDVMEGLVQGGSRAISGASSPLSIASMIAMGKLFNAPGMLGFLPKAVFSGLFGYEGAKQGYEAAKNPGSVREKTAGLTSAGINTILAALPMLAEFTGHGGTPAKSASDPRGFLSRFMGEESPALKPQNPASTPGPIPTPTPEPIGPAAPVQSQPAASQMPLPQPPKPGGGQMPPRGSGAWVTDPNYVPTTEPMGPPAPPQSPANPNVMLPVSQLPPSTPWNELFGNSLGEAVPPPEEFPGMAKAEGALPPVQTVPPKFMGQTDNPLRVTGKEVAPIGSPKPTVPAPEVFMGADMKGIAEPEVKIPSNIDTISKWVEPETPSLASLRRRFQPDLSTMPSFLHEMMKRRVKGKEYYPEAVQILGKNIANMIFGGGRDAMDIHEWARNYEEHGIRDAEHLLQTLRDPKKRSRSGARMSKAELLSDWEHEKAAWKTEWENGLKESDWESIMEALRLADEENPGGSSPDSSTLSTEPPITRDPGEEGFIRAAGDENRRPSSVLDILDWLKGVNLPRERQKGMLEGYKEGRTLPKELVEEGKKAGLFSDESGFASLFDNADDIKIPGQSKDQGKTDLIKKIMKAPAGNISKRDLLGLDKKKKGPAKPSPLLDQINKGMFP